MTKLTLVTDAAGKLVAAVEGHDMMGMFDGVEARVSFSHGHKLHKIVADIDLETIGGEDDFGRIFVALLPKG